MKKLILTILCSGMIIQPIHAVSLKERAQQVYHKAIALAQKGGVKSKELLQKANFLGNAIKESNEAHKAYIECKHKSCRPQKAVTEKMIRERRSIGEKWDIAVYNWNVCFASKCSVQIKRDDKADRRLIASLSAVILIIVAAAVAGGAAIYAKEEKKEAEWEGVQKLEKEARKEIFERPESPIYEKLGL